MADNYAICILGTMDRLWFHQIILFTEPTSLLFPKTLNSSQPISQTLPHLSSNLSQIPFLEEEISSSASSIITPSEDDCNNQQVDDVDDDEDENENEIKMKKRSTRLNDILTCKSRSHSSSLLHHIHPKKIIPYSRSVTRLQKTMSCKSLLELELEEVKGFMDLGFKFSKESLSPQMMSVLPGLQRLELANGDEEVDKDDRDIIGEEEREGEEEKRSVMRPYLSEAWDIKRPDSPLLNLRLPRVSAAGDMKKHLRYWASTVASVIQQEF
ncbi:hypothetical protein ACSBR1_002984 [Camellia fascicularis]